MAVVCLLAALAAGWTAADALVITPAPPPQASATHDPLFQELPRPSASLEAVLRAASWDPFDPERRATGRRLVFEEPADVALEAGVDGQLRLIGVALLPGGTGFALCAWGNEPPRIVRLNEAVGPYTLQTVRPGQAEFSDPSGEHLTLDVPKGGS
jgi:hypothetical protein